MSGAVKDYAVGYVKRTVRRYLVRVGVGTVVVLGSLGYRSVTGSTGEAPKRAASGTRHGARTASAALARDSMRTVELAGAPAPVAAPAAAAAPQQLGIPNIKNTLDKAHNAADATNRNIAEQTGQAVKSSRGTPAPAVTAPRSGPGSVPAVPVTGPAAAVAAAAVPQVTREVFSYAAEGRRDPFFSLILTEDLRPLLSDLKLVGILYDGTGKRSVAIMRDLQTNAQYRVGSGQTLGRMRVTQIKPKGVIFSIDEFGLSRQDSLVLTDTTKVRN